jgi:hypothetical protein
MSIHRLSLEIEVFDRELLAKASRAHFIAAVGFDYAKDKDFTVNDDLQMLLDPGAGGSDTWTGLCESAGFRVIESSTETLVADADGTEMDEVVP